MNREIVAGYTIKNGLKAIKFLGLYVVSFDSVQQWQN